MRHRSAGGSVTELTRVSNCHTHRVPILASDTGDQPVHEHRSEICISDSRRHCGEGGTRSVAAKFRAELEGQKRQGSDGSR